MGRNPNIIRRTNRLKLKRKIMRELDIKVRLKRDKTLFTRVENELYLKVEVLAQKHKVPLSVVVKSLIEEGLRSLK